MKNISPDIRSFRRNLSLLQEFDKSNDEKEQAMNIIKAIEQLEEEKKAIQERQKCLLESEKRLLDAANNNPHVGEILTSTKRKLSDYRSTESLKSMDSLVLCPVNESSVLRNDAKRKRRKGDVGKIFDIITENNEDTASQASALGKVLRHKKLKSIVKEAGFVDKEDNEYKSDEKMKQNQRAYVQRALETSSNRGRATDDRRAAAESIVTSVLETPENAVATPIQKVKAIKRLFPMPNTSAKRLIKNVQRSASCKNIRLTRCDGQALLQGVNTAKLLVS